MLVYEFLQQRFVFPVFTKVIKIFQSCHWNTISNLNWNQFLDFGNISFEISEFNTILEKLNNTHFLSATMNLKYNVDVNDCYATKCYKPGQITYM